eukprot:m.204367 g.204367  ORF g.204367 m.204367 type:complete len:92 (-) comp18466_c0_seq18:1497-1772(-)
MDPLTSRDGDMITVADALDVAQNLLSCEPQLDASGVLARLQAELGPLPPTWHHQVLFLVQERANVAATTPTSKESLGPPRGFALLLPCHVV